MVEQYRYLETNLKNIYSIHKYIKKKFKSGYSCYHSAKKRLSSSSLTKNIKIKIHRVMILPCIMKRCETWSLTLREELRLMVSQNRVLGRIFGPKMELGNSGERKLHNDKVKIYTRKYTLFVL